MERNLRRLGAHRPIRPLFTALGTLLIVGLGMAAGSLSHPLYGTWAGDLRFGLQPLIDGRWWTVLTGAAFGLEPKLYVPVLVSFIGLVGLAEQVGGTLRAAAMWLTGHLVGVLGALGLIALFAHDGLRRAVDAGPSGGALFAGYLAAGALPSRWRSALRGGVLGYALLWFVFVHHLADVVHLVAVLAAALVALVWGDSWLAGRSGRPDAEPTGPAAEPGRSRRSGTEVDHERARNLLRTHGGGTMSWMTTWPDLSYCFSPDGDGYVGYRVHAGVALALGDPVGTPQWRDRAATVFAAHCRARGLRPVWFAVSSETAALTGARTLQVAEDSLLDLSDLEFRGKRWQDVRTARNRAARESIHCWIGPLADQTDSVQAQCRALSEAWLATQRCPELGFTLGGIAQALDPDTRVAIALDAGGTVHGITSWLPIHGPGGRIRGWTLDLMRRGQGFAPVMEYLIAEACVAFRGEGAEIVSLSGAPLAHSRGAEVPGDRLQRLLDGSARLLEPLYGFASLHAFKHKFSPRPEPLMLCYRRRRDLPGIGLAVLLAFLHSPTRATEPTTLPARRPSEEPMLLPIAS